MTHPIQVAILDDDPWIRRALSRLLSATGMIVNAYATASLFFDSLALRPNCLLLDFQMPEMNGLEVLKVLSQRNIRIPTIIITGHGGSGSREACIAAGAVAYLRKPLDTDQLIEAIVNASERPSHLV